MTVGIDKDPRVETPRILTRLATAGFIEYSDGGGAALPPDGRVFSLTDAGRTAAAWDAVDDDEGGMLLHKLWMDDGIDRQPLLNAAGKTADGEDSYTLNPAGFTATWDLADSPLGEDDLKSVGGYTSAVIMLTAASLHAKGSVDKVESSLREGTLDAAAKMLDAGRLLVDKRQAALEPLEEALALF